MLTALVENIMEFVKRLPSPKYCESCGKPITPQPGSYSVSANRRWCNAYTEAQCQHAQKVKCVVDQKEGRSNAKQHAQFGTTMHHAEVQRQSMGLPRGARMDICRADA